MGWSNGSSPLVATKFLVISKGEGTTHFIHSVPAVRRDPEGGKLALLAVALFL